MTLFIAYCLLFEEQSSFITFLKEQIHRRFLSFLYRNSLSVNLTIFLVLVIFPYKFKIIFCSSNCLFVLSSALEVMMQPMLKTCKKLLMMQIMMVMKMRMWIIVARSVWQGHTMNKLRGPGC